MEASVFWTRPGRSAELPVELIGGRSSDFRPDLEGAERVPIGARPAPDKERVFPDVLAIGYIPYYPNLGAVPNPAFRALSFRWRVGLSLVFASGNPEPASSFPPPDELDVLLRSRQFRAVSQISRVRAYLDEQDQIVGFSCERWVKTGYTPYRFLGPRRMKDPLAVPFVGGPHPALGARRRWRFFRSIDGTSVTISHPFAFKLGRIGDFLCRLTMGFFAAAAGMTLQYTVRADGSSSARVEGSVFPSIALYKRWPPGAGYNSSDWERLSVSKIDEDAANGTCSPATVRDFIVGPRCRDARPMERIVS